MSKVKVELNLQGLNEVMKSSAMQSALNAAGSAVISAAGGDYAMRTDELNWVAITNVYPNSEDAAHDNFKNNTLLKAVGSVGLPMHK